LGRSSLAGDINFGCVEGDILYFSMADKVAITLHDDVAPFAKESKIGTPHYYILGKTLVQSRYHRFAALLDPSVVEPGKDIPNSNLLRLDLWLTGHKDFPR